MPLPFHPYSEMFELIVGTDFSELVEDIRRHGLREKIVVADGQILDGRNRYRAALAAGVIDGDDLPEDRPMIFQRFVSAVDGSALAYVVSKNIHRRHLSAGQRAYAMAEYEKFRHGGARQPDQEASEQDANLQLDRSETRAALADKAHVSERSIASAAVVRDHGVADLKAAVRQGEIAVSAAEQIARLPEPEQPAAIAAALPNGARSIMSSRQEPDDSLDFFPTPPWAARALLDRVLPVLGVRDIELQAAWEPACGEGHIAEVLKEHFAEVISTDIVDYGYGDRLMDFLQPTMPPIVDWIITNPPFGDKAEEFVLRSLDFARVGVAMFVRLQWLETIGRYERLFRDKPPTLVAFFCERVNLCKGLWDPEGSTATAYIWLVWIKGRAPRAPFWIPPGCRETLTHADDAERFTTHPVTRKPAPLPAVTDDPGPAHSASVDPSLLDIPANLRRGAGGKAPFMRKEAAPAPSVDCRVCSEGSGVCAECIAAGEHLVVMTNSAADSIATCSCGWANSMPWGSRGFQDAAVRAHWQNVITETNAAASSIAEAAE